MPAVAAVAPRAPESPVAPPTVAPVDPSEAPVTNYWRVLYASGLFVAVTMLLFSYLDGSIVGTSVFGTVAFVCLVLLVVPGRSEG
jgi:hypothetical protein